MEYTVEFYGDDEQIKSHTFDTRWETFSFLDELKEQGREVFQITATLTVKTTVKITHNELNDYPTVMGKFNTV